MTLVRKRADEVEVGDHILIRKGEYNIEYAHAWTVVEDQEEVSYPVGAKLVTFGLQSLRHPEIKGEAVTRAHYRYRVIVPTELKVVE